MAAFIAAGILGLLDPGLAAVPLSLFILLCISAPFISRFGFFLPVVTRGRTGTPSVALTFDDSPDPLSTPHLLALLARHKATAAFFITGIKAEAYPDLIRLILSHGHEVGNHSHTHDNFLMLKSDSIIRREIEKTQHTLNAFGVRPLAFRPPVGVTGPRLEGALADAGVFCVNFSLRPGDRGNRSLNNLSGKILRRVRPDDIILLHDVAPPHAPLSDWLKEMDRLIWGLRKKGFAILPLSELIKKPVMR